MIATPPKMNLLHTQYQIAVNRLNKGLYKGKNLSIRRNSDINLIKEYNKRNRDLVTSKNPFVVPTENTLRNETRYLQISAILREYLHMMFASHPVAYKDEFFVLFGFLDNLFAMSHREFCVVSARLANWVKVFCLSNNDSQGDIPDSEWDRLNRAPRPVATLIRWFREEEDKETQRLFIRAILSMLSIYKVLTVPTSPSLESITKVFNGEDETGDSINFKNALLMLGINLEDRLEEFKNLCVNAKFHESMAAGPNGHCIWSAHLDAYELARDSVLFNNLLILGKKLSLNAIIQRLQECVFTYHTHDIEANLKGRSRHSKLHVLYEKGVKARIIAIGDYFTQCILSPFHSLSASVLSSIPNDGTYDQDGAFEKVLEFTRRRLPLFSIDLSKATDRLPLKIQVKLMSLLVGDKDIAELWAKVMADREFVTDTGHKVRYEVGQPMGFKSSFPMLALLHHCIVMEAATRAGLTEFSDYVILGDDIVIANAAVAREYTSLMTSIGMELSPNKSISCGTDFITGAEFCSRLALNGVEVTPLPLNAILQAMDDQRSIPSLWETLGKRSLFIGQAYWEFVAIFLQSRDLEYLAMLNAIPQIISGLRFVMPYIGFSEFSPENLKSLGFHMNDLVNYYFYVLVSEAIAKVDAAVKRSRSLVNILSTESRTRPDDLNSELFDGSIQSLVRIVSSQLTSKGENAIVHPIQDVMISIAQRVIALLNMFNGPSIDYKRLLASPLLGSLHFSLDQRASYAPLPDSVLGDRRVLEKALRMISVAVKEQDKRTSSYTGRIEGVSSLWLVRVTLGGKLIVLPHVPKLTTIATGGSTRLVGLRKSGLLGQVGLNSKV